MATAHIPPFSHILPDSWWLRTPRLAAHVTAADRRVRTQAVLLQPSGFQTCCFLHLLLPRCHETVQELFSYPVRRFLHARDRRRHHRCHRRGTRPVNKDRHRSWTSDLFSSRPRPELGGSPVGTPAYTPGDSQTSRVYSNNPVLHLYISYFYNVFRLQSKTTPPPARCYQVRGIDTMNIIVYLVWHVLVI